MNPRGVIIAPEHVRRRLEHEHGQLGGLKPVANQYGVSAAMIWRIINEGYVPKTYELQKKLGYIPTCPICGHEFGEDDANDQA